MAFDEGDEEGEQDVWIYDEERKKIVRIHKQARKATFTLSHTRGCPVPMRYLTSQRKTYKVFGDGSRKVEKVDWRGEVGNKEEAAMRWWTGFTEFTLRRIPAEVSLMVKRGSDEVHEKTYKALRSGKSGRWQVGQSGPRWKPPELSRL